MRRGRGLLDRFRVLHIRNEAITMPDHGADKVRVPGVVPENHSQFVDGRVNAVLGLENTIAAPDVLLDGLSADQFSWTLQ